MCTKPSGFAVIREAEHRGRLYSEGNFLETHMAVKLLIRLIKKPENTLPYLSGVCVSRLLDRSSPSEPGERPCLEWRWLQIRAEP